MIFELEIFKPIRLVCSFWLDVALTILKSLSSKQRITFFTSMNNSSLKMHYLEETFMKHLRTVLSRVYVIL